LYRNIVSESFTFPANCCNISWKKENVISAAKQKKCQEIVKKLIKMGTLLKSLSGIRSAAEMAIALQVPEELPSDKKVDDWSHSFINKYQKLCSSPIYLANSLTCCFHTLLQKVGSSLWLY